MSNPYRHHGCDSRDEYLEKLAYDFDIDFETVCQLADMLGPNEDFDGLPRALEDYDE